MSRFLDENLEKLELAESDRRILGAILVEEDCLQELHVATQFQGRGVGRRLLRRAENLGARRLEVRAFNERAIRFYERVGWLRLRTFRTTEMGLPVLSHEYVAPQSRQHV